MSETTARPAGAAPQKAPITEKLLHPVNGIAAFAGLLAGLLASVLLFVFAVVADTAVWLVAPALVLFLASCIGMGGVRVVHPNEALVLTLFGRYYGTITAPGCFWVNPFCTAPAGKKAVSLKLNTLKNDKQKVNDAQGNPILIGSNVIWRVADPTKAVFNVERYDEFISIQTDSTIRNIARLYPYDLIDEDPTDGIDINAEEKTLRSSRQEIAANMRDELQKRVEEAGIVIEEVKITDLAYSEEIAAAMLQRQQATAIIAARAKIVDGAVGMVKMALDRLSEDDIVLLDDERKAAMVSNLLVVLCSGKDAQPVVNSGSIYG